MLSLFPFCALAADEWEKALRVEVIEKAPGTLNAAAKILPKYDIADDTHFSTDSLTNLVAGASAISTNGQGGLFQTYNIRGFARWRIQTLVEGVPIHTDRRAGSAAEFLAPSMMDKAQLVYGAASTQLGSGAIGGGIDFSLFNPVQTTMDMSYGSNNDYREVTLAGSDPEHHVSWALNHRHANSSSNGRGEPLYDGFEVHSLMARQRNQQGMVRDALVLYSTANNVAKASAHPVSEQFTRYPDNDHLLAKAVFGWQNLTIYAHSAHTTTLTQRPGVRTNEVENNAVSSGFHLSDTKDLIGGSLQWRTGLDSRLNVSADELEMDEQHILVTEQRTMDAEQVDMYVALDYSRTTIKGTWAAGTRVAVTYQSNRLEDQSQKDANLSGFIGYQYSLSQHWALTGYLSHAYRVPSLTERYYAGSTPRGEVFGDANLPTEKARNIDLSLLYTTPSTRFSLSYFHQNIVDYIERLAVSDTIRQYQALEAANINGVNYQLKQRFILAGFSGELSLSGQWISGEDNNRQPVADIPPSQHRAALSLFFPRGNGYLAVMQRASSHEQVDGELPTESVNRIDVGYSHDVATNTKLSVHFRNVTDAYYVVSRDDLAPYARGREWVASVKLYF